MSVATFGSQAITFVRSTYSVVGVARQEEYDPVYDIDDYVSQVLIDGQIVLPVWGQITVDEYRKALDDVKENVVDDVKFSKVKKDLFAVLDSHYSLFISMDFVDDRSYDFGDLGRLSLKQPHNSRRYASIVCTRLRDGRKAFLREMLAGEQKAKVDELPVEEYRVQYEVENGPEEIVYKKIYFKNKEVLYIKKQHFPFKVKKDGSNQDWLRKMHAKVRLLEEQVGDLGTDMKYIRPEAPLKKRESVQGAKETYASKRARLLSAGVERNPGPYKIALKESAVTETRTRAGTIIHDVVMNIISGAPVRVSEFKFHVASPVVPQKMNKYRVMLVLEPVSTHLEVSVTHGTTTYPYIFAPVLGVVNKFFMNISTVSPEIVVHLSDEYVHGKGEYYMSCCMTFKEEGLVVVANTEVGKRSPSMKKFGGGYKKQDKIRRKRKPYRNAAPNQEG